MSIMTDIDLADYEAISKEIRKGGKALDDFLDLVYEYVNDHSGYCDLTFTPDEDFEHKDIHKGVDQLTAIRNSIIKHYEEEGLSDPMIPEKDKVIKAIRDIEFDKLDKFIASNNTIDAGNERFDGDGELLQKAADLAQQLEDMGFHTVYLLWDEDTDRLADYATQVGFQEELKRMEPLV